MTDSILTDLSTPSLARAIKENLYDYFDALGRSEIAQIDEGPGWLRWRTPVFHPWFNGVLCTRPPVEGDTALVESSLAFFRSQGTPSLTWWLSPDQPSAAWGPYLQPHGFHFDDSTPGMAIALEALPKEERLPAGLEIIPVDDEAALRTWVDVFAEGYPTPSEMKEPLFSLLAGLGLDLPVRHYLGLLDGVPAATSNLFLGAGVAGVMFVATLPTSRGRGVGAAMTLSPLYEARDLGYRAGIWQSSQMGYPIYRKLGFQHLTAMEIYYWSG
jgi:GNAT superfamily N-acetyltransferase